MRGARVLASAGALAAASIACREHAPSPRNDATNGCLRVDGPRDPVGFDATFAIAAKLDCAGRTTDRGGRIAWTQIEGPTVRELAPARDGFQLTARAPSLADAVGGAIPWGVVPLSPRTRGEIVLRATWSDDRGGSETADVRVVAAYRSRGLPNTPVGVRVHLGGAGWQITTRPATSTAALDTTAGVASLLPDVSGDWRLTDGGGRTLALRSGRYDETPLDCGRAGCHPSITDASAASPMTTVFARLLDAGPAGYPGCALRCHTTGEPGARDGGFAHVASELGAAGELEGRRWDALPRDLHRLGGVGCLACHGPGAIPEASARWGILRSDVCAVCHDAPPRYGHAVALRLSAMSRADQDPRARGEAACARCHTTAGFLAAVARPERAPIDRRAPDGAGGIGITCSACHAVHDPERRAPGVRLLRRTPVPRLLAGAAESVCLPCHTPDAAEARPSASAGAIWLGRGGLDPATGEPLAVPGPAPHAAIWGGCVGCHRGGPDNLQRGAGHAFRAPESACAGCHGPKPPSPDLRARARTLWASVQAADAGRPPHAEAARIGRDTPRGRALWDLLLVLEDPAAAAHNARYAGALLDAAAAVLQPGNDARTPR